VSFGIAPHSREALPVTESLPGPDVALPPEVAEIQSAYTFEEAAIELGVLIEDDRPMPQV
jgi:hypothetical protein